MEKIKLLQYLGAVRDLEGIVYVHEKSIKTLNQQYQTISRRVNNNEYTKLQNHTYDQYDIPPMSDEVCNKKGMIMGVTTLIACGIASFLGGPIFAMIGNGFDATTDEVAGTISVLLFISLIISLVVGFKFANSCREKFSYGSKKWREIENRNREIKEENEKLRRWDNHQLRLIPQEISLLKDNLSKAQSLLWDYYRVDILHSDYQNMVAVCSIYQYLDSGRCAELTGREGAYNLFEEEKFKNIIISKLDEIIKRLDQIQRTQSQLYYLMRDCEAQIYELTNATHRMSEKLNSIKDCAQITAYNTTYLKQNEEYRVLLNGY